MKIEEITFRSKTWGVIHDPEHPGHFHTGYEGEWGGTRWQMNREIGPPKAHMRIGHNVIITGDFRINSMSRGRSAANFEGVFRDHPGIEYSLSMDGVTDLFALVQDGHFPISDLYIRGRWTFAKQGQNIFLRPFYSED